MDLFGNLKQLKNIEAGREFTKKSRGLVLASLNIEPSANKKVFGTLLSVFDVVASLALAGFLIVLILGGVSSFKAFQPLQITAIDPANIKAEAQAVDLQIQLANLNYKDSSVRSSGESTVPSGAKKQSNTKNTSNEKVANSDQLSIDEALRLLSE